MSNAIPSEILEDIRRVAKRDWPDDWEIQQDHIKSEVKAYRALQELDFGEATLVKEVIIEEVSQIHERWDDRLSVAKNEIDAFSKLRALSHEDIPTNIIHKIKEKAAI